MRTRVSTPPLPSVGFAPVRPMDIVRATYDFAAQHPEILKYVPCYCGCGEQGHKANESCFVARRDAKGNVLEWDTHGFGCTICVDVAREAMQLYASGADVVSIRAAIERKWTPGNAGGTRRPRPHHPRRSRRALDERMERDIAFARLFQSVREGVYMGTLGANSTSDPRRQSPPESDLRLSAGRRREPRPAVRAVALRRSASAPDLHRAARSRRRRRSITCFASASVDGTPIWIEVSATASHRPRDAEQSQLAVLHVEALVRDVSERKKTDDQSRDGRYQMLQAEKMAALGQTISGVAHELNNPLATILSWAERLSERNVDEKTKQGLEVILGESERAARIVRNLLTFARKRQTTRAMVDLNQVVRETLALRAYEQKVTNIQVVEALATGLPDVFADGHQIKQVLLNLLINAEQACLGANGKGTIVVRTSHDTDRGSRGARGQ